MASSSSMTFLLRNIRSVNLYVQRFTFRIAHRSEHLAIPIMMNNASESLPDVLIADFVVLKLDASSSNDVAHCVTRFLDLPDKIILQICGYLSPARVLRSFYTPDRPHLRPHTIIEDYYQKIQLDRLTSKDYEYIEYLFRCSKHPLRPQSLILSNEHVDCLIERFFSRLSWRLTESIFQHVQNLTLINCSLRDLGQIHIAGLDLRKIAQLHFIVRKEVNQVPTSTSFRNLSDDDINKEYQASLNNHLFHKQMACQTLHMEIPRGLQLCHSLRPIPTLRNLHLSLQTIDDLYVLINGLVPNVQILTVHVLQARILTCCFPSPTSWCHRLKQFALFDHGIGLVLHDLKSVLYFIQNVSDLTLSIRDTPDRSICHGPTLELALNTYLRSLDRFDCTMTHRIADEQFLGGFTQWPISIVFYEDQGCRWTHIYSYPWPSRKEDQRRLPLVQGECDKTVHSNVNWAQGIDHLLISTVKQFAALNNSFRWTSKITTALLINRRLPSQISTLVLTGQRPNRLTKCYIHHSVRHLIVQRRLIDTNELLDLADQFPNVEYLELFFRRKISVYISFFKQLLSRKDDDGGRYTFHRLTHFATDTCPDSTQDFSSADLFRVWLMQNTDLKYYPSSFYTRVLHRSISLWL